MLFIWHLLVILVGGCNQFSVKITFYRPRTHQYCLGRFYLLVLNYYNKYIFKSIQFSSVTVLTVVWRTRQPPARALCSFACSHNLCELCSLLFPRISPVLSWTYYCVAGKRQSVIVPIHMPRMNSDDLGNRNWWIITKVNIVKAHGATALSKYWHVSRHYLGWKDNVGWCFIHFTSDI